MSIFSIVVYRKKSSWDFTEDKNFKPTAGVKGFINRRKNNYNDTIQILKNGIPIFTGVCQSVANHPNAPMDGSWSLAPGKCTVTLFQEPRSFNCPVHGIGEAVDMKGHRVSPISFDIGKSGNRFLLHDDTSRGPKGVGKRDSGAYSEGCIIQPQPQFNLFNKCLVDNGLVPGSKIPMEIIQEK